MDMSKFGEMPIKQFVEMGFLQEVNRLFFHPAGLALVVSNVDGEYKLDKIIDCRSEPNVLTIHGTATEMVKKGIMVSQSVQTTCTIRVESLGFDIQPLRKITQPQVDLSDQPLQEK